MRLYLSTALTILCLLTATAQDIIVKIDGDTLKVYDLKVNAKFITYRETPGKDAPSRRIGKAKVLSVKKRNAKSVIISKPIPVPEFVPDTVWQTQKVSVENPAYKQQKTSNEKQKGEIQRSVAPDNAALVAAYNKNYSGYGNKKPKKEKVARAVAIMGVSAGSILSNEDIEVEILKSSETFQYKILVQNKSDNIIYLDLENCFRINNDGTFKAYYSGKQIRQNKKSNSKVSISTKNNTSRPQYIDGRKTITRSTTFTLEDKAQTSQVVKEQKILAIPSKGKVALPPCVSLNDYEEFIEEYDAFYATLPVAQYPLHVSQVTNIAEQQAPYKNSFIITYSPNKKFETYSTVKFSLYLKKLISLGTRFSKFDETLIHGYDRYTICGKIYFE